MMQNCPNIFAVQCDATIRGHEVSLPLHPLPAGRYKNSF
jgi:hypothetical protein